MRSMKEGKEDEKSMRPLFPRLHVNDADKGGPRAPPRNKMSLYEQFSIPSQKFSSATLPPLKPGSLVPSTSLERNHERTAYSPFCLSYSTPTISAENLYSQSSDGKSIKNMGMEIDRSTSREYCKSYHTAVSDADGRNFNVHDLTSEKISFKTKYDDDDDFRVPTLLHSEVVSHVNDAPSVEVNRPTHVVSNAQKSNMLDSSFHVLGSFRKPIHDANASEKVSKIEKINGEQESREALSCKKHGDEFPNILVGEMLADPSKNPLAPSDRGAETKMKFFNKTSYQNSVMANESPHNGSIVGLKSSNDSQFHEKRNSSNMRSESSSGASSEFSHGSFGDKTNGSGELKNTERTVEVSEASMIESISGLELSPDDVVGVIGPKQFWKARREIVNQQRVFAIQVFELHRLIKVQKLFAASPRLLLDDSHIIKIQSKVSTKSPSIASSLNYHSLKKPNSLVEKPAGPALQAQERNPNNDLVPLPRNIPHSTNSPPIPLPLDNRPSPWCFPPPPNQWLIPVMSPSEGLIYKPYTGLCPPNSGFMSPLYGNFGSLSMPPATGNYMNAPYVVPSSHQQQNRIFPVSPVDPNYCMPSMNPVITTSAVEQASPLTSARPNGHTMQLSQSSCNMSITKSEAISGYPSKNVAFKDSELHASTASSPCDRARGKGRDILPLFPISPAKERSCQPSQSSGENHQTHVIRVVPHNARTATESAARIFRSIQEERRRF